MSPRLQWTLAVTLSLASPEAAAQRGRHPAAPMPSPIAPASGFARARLDACAQGDATACRVAAVHIARGDGGARRDGAAAAALLLRAWSIQRDEGCGWFYTLRDELPPSGVAVACARGCTSACEARAIHRAALDPQEGASELDRLCDGGSAHACYVLGHALLDGLLIPGDRRGALEHVARACDLGGSNACFEMSHEGWDQELLRIRRSETDPERLRATAPLSALRRGASRTRRPLVRDRARDAAPDRSLANERSRERRGAE